LERFIEKRLRKAEERRLRKNESDCCEPEQSWGKNQKEEEQE
jgi:hypothetical protein